MMELLMVIALTGIISVAITTAVFQVYHMNTRTANDMIAVSQVQQAGKVVSQDILQARTVDPDDAGGTPEVELLTLGWTDWATGHAHKVIYTLVDMTSGALKILWREHYVKADGDFELDSSTKVAEYIDPDRTSCCCDCNGDGDCDDDCDCGTRVLVFTVTATVGEESETRTYKVQPRPGS